MINSKQRISNLQTKFVEVFKRPSTHIFASPGRMELLGNHTDNNHGKCLASTINLDIKAAVAVNNISKIRAISEGNASLITIDINDLGKRPREVGKSNAMIRGVLAYLADHGYKLGGFDVYLDSYIPRGAGVSSSAAYELLFAKVVSTLFNDDRIDPTTLAKAAQFAEVYYFGKAAGLLDQLSIAYGGVVELDFADIAQPTVKRVNFDLGDEKIFIINTGGSHAKLSAHYEAIAVDMSKVAHYFKAKYLREVTHKDFLAARSTLFASVGGRAVLRSQHFFEENERVDAATIALKNNDKQAFLKNIHDSGTSSFEKLQNLTYGGDEDQRLLATYLLIRSTFPSVAVRVHGGGFAGTLLAFVGKKFVDSFTAFISDLLGKDSLIEVEVIETGSTEVKYD